MEQIFTICAGVTLLVVTLALVAIGWIACLASERPIDPSEYDDVW